MVLCREWGGLVSVGRWMVEASGAVSMGGAHASAAPCAMRMRSRIRESVLHSVQPVFACFGVYLVLNPQCKFDFPEQIQNPFLEILICTELH